MTNKGLIFPKLKERKDQKVMLFPDMHKLFILTVKLFYPK